jgi:hypothetical protein
MFLDHLEVAEVGLGDGPQTAYVGGASRPRTTQPILLRIGA